MISCINCTELSKISKQIGRPVLAIDSYDLKERRDWLQVESIGEKTINFTNVKGNDLYSFFLDDIQIQEHSFYYQLEIVSNPYYQIRIMKTDVLDSLSTFIKRSVLEIDNYHPEERREWMVLENIDENSIHFKHEDKNIQSSFLLENCVLKEHIKNFYYCLTLKNNPTYKILFMKL